MQRMKGQGTAVPNGPKDQNYSNPMTSSMAAAPAPSDQYMSSFYMPSTPYQTFGVGDATWSNGGEHVQHYMGSYSGQVGFDSHNAIDGIFNSGNFGGFNATGYNYGFHGNGDYNAWGAADARSCNKHFDDYYQRSVYGEDRLKGLEQGVQGISLSDKTGQELSKDNTGSPNSDACSADKIGDVGGESANMGAISQPKKGLSWASVASQPAKPQPSRRRDKTATSSIVANRHMDIGTWESKNGGPKPVAPPPAPRPAWEAPRGGSRSTNSTSYSTPPPKAPIHAAPPPTISPQPQQHIQPPLPHQQQAYHPVVNQFNQASHVPPPAAHQTQLSSASLPQQQASPPQHAPPPQAKVSPLQGNAMASEICVSAADTSANAAPVHESTVVHEEEEDSPTLDDLQLRNEYNPKEIEMCTDNARFFVIKSYSEDDIHRSIKYEIWCSTEHGNKRLDCAFRERESKGPIYLFFSVNGSGHFCGIAQMISQVDYNSSASVWAQDKWKGQFRVKWIYVKDVPNSQLRHIRLENNENKPVTNSRDTQEVPPEKGKQVIKIIHTFRHKTSIFDDFFHYEKRQEETEFRRGHQEIEREERRPEHHQRHADPRMDYRDHREPHRDYHRGGYEGHHRGHGGRGRGGHDHHRGHYQHPRGGRQ